MKITVFNSQTDLKISKLSVKKSALSLGSFLNIQTDEFVIHFVSTKKICDLHKDFFNDPSPTDCITFPIDPSGTKSSEHTVLGEIFICPKTALNFSHANNLDPHEEVTLYLIHGLLHLIGYQDKTSAQCKKMRKQEQICMKFLKDENLLLKKNLSNYLI